MWSIIAAVSKAFLLSPTERVETSEVSSIPAASTVVYISILPEVRPLEAAFTVIVPASVVDLTPISLVPSTVFACLAPVDLSWIQPSHPTQPVN